MKKGIAALALLIALTGSVWYFRKQPQAQSATPEQLAFWEELTRDCGEDITHFTGYHALSLYQGDKVALLISGLQHPNPVVRWFAAYHSIEYMGTSDAARITPELLKLNHDSNEQVKQAVRFAISFFDGNYRYHPWTKTSPDYKTRIFYRYHAAQYNDGQVWQVKNNKPSLLQEFKGSIKSVYFSPDSHFLAVNYGGSNWGSVSLIEITTESLIEIFPWLWLEEQGIEVPSSYSRLDPYVVFRDWSADAQEVLLYYAYHTPEYERMYGHAVYSVGERRVVRGTLPVKQNDLIFVDKTALGWK